jgi:hypothetical protein
MGARDGMATRDWRIHTRDLTRNHRIHRDPDRLEYLGKD